MLMRRKRRRRATHASQPPLKSEESRNFHFDMQATFVPLCDLNISNDINVAIHKWTPLNEVISEI